MSNYTCKIATLDDIIKKYDYEIDKASDKYNWRIWKDKAIDRFNKKQVITYIGLLDDEIISEASADLVGCAVTKNEGLVDEKTVYLFAFRTNSEYIGQGYFSILFKYMINDLKERGYERVTIGVEPEEIKNKAIYQKYGFTDYIKTEKEPYPDGTIIEAEYYAKKIK